MKSSAVLLHGKWAHRHLPGCQSAQPPAVNRPTANGDLLRLMPNHRTLPVHQRLQRQLDVEDRAQQAPASRDGTERAERNCQKVVSVSVNGAHESTTGQWNTDATHL